MPVVISLLRAVNLGGRNQVSMERLRGLYDSLGLEEPRSYVQSGNVVFRTKERNLVALGARLEKAIEGEFGFRPAVILRTVPEIKQLVEINPFAKRTDVAPAKLLVTFLASKVEAQVRATMMALVNPGGEEVFAFERELFIFFPDGVGRSKLNAVKLEKLAGCAGTARNWNTVLKLIEIGEELGARK